MGAKKQTFSIRWMNVLLFSHIYTLSITLFQQAETQDDVRMA
jgi:hypothetical protein